MTKNVSMIRKIGGLGLAGALAMGAGQAAAVDFQVSADVQNALDVTVVNDMALGTLFATTASTGAVGILRLTPGGGISGVTDGSGEPKILGLGGQVPARGSVAVTDDTEFTIELPPAVYDTGNLADGQSTDASLIGGVLEGAADAVELRLGGDAGNPDVARLYLVNFTVGDVTGGSISGDTAGAATDCTSATRLDAAGDSIDCLITPAFDSTAVEFAIGADIVTDSAAGRDTYQAGTYTGTLTVTATY